MWKWTWLLAATLGLMPMPARAQQAVAVWTPMGYQQITLTVVTPLTVPTGGARMAQICVEAQAVRWRDDGVAPSTTVGMPIASGSCMIYSGSLSAISFITQVAGGILDVSYYR